MELIERRASCTCGQLRLSVRGEPLRTSMCHCFVCQRRTGSVFGAQARYPRERVGPIEGESTTYVRHQEEGGTASFHFCPRCGATLFYELSFFMPECIGIPLGAFADPSVPPPTVSVHEARKHSWVVIPPSVVERADD